MTDFIFKNYVITTNDKITVKGELYGNEEKFFMDGVVVEIEMKDFDDKASIFKCYNNCTYGLE